MSELTIVIVTFNSSHVIANLLSLIYERGYDVIISDNGSSDDTIQIIEEQFPAVNIIKNCHNIGFARANNKGFLSANTEFVATINPDCLVYCDDIAKILAVMIEHPEVAIASGQLYKGFFNKEQKKITFTNKDETLIKNYISEHSQFYYSKFISGCFMIMRKSVFDKIGFFDQNFFLYCEDNELCKRVLKNKHKMAIVKNTKICHLGGHSANNCTKTGAKFEYLILWHKLGWSKLYYTQAVHNRFVASLKAIRNIMKMLILVSYHFIKDRKIPTSYKAIFCASFAYLFGKKAFDKDGRANFKY